MHTITDSTILTPNFPTWCPGCGDFGIWAAIKKALTELNLPEEQLVVVFDIGCSGNMADFIRCYGFHALHGRSLPVAEGIKMANHGVKVLVIGGDGGIYGEGMGHFIAACRGNHDITLLVHDNQVYGLTTGQTAPTSKKGTMTKSTPQGVIEVPVNPVSLALTVGAGWIGRSYSGDIAYTADLLKKAIAHPGFALLDVFQPCVTFNKANSHQWYQNTVLKTENMDGYDAHDLELAWKTAHMSEKLPIGLLYEADSFPYHAQIPLLAKDTLVNVFASKVNLAHSLDVLK